MATATRYQKEVETLDQELEAVRADLQEEQRTEEIEKVFLETFDKFLAIAQSICDINRDWRGMVLRDEFPFEATLDAQIRGLFSGWIFLKVNIANPLLDRFKARGTKFGDRLAKLEGHSDEVTRILIDWKPPVRATSPALRTIKVPRGHPLCQS